MDTPLDQGSSLERERDRLRAELSDARRALGEAEDRAGRRALHLHHALQTLEARLAPGVSSAGRSLDARLAELVRRPARPSADG